MPSAILSLRVTRNGIVGGGLLVVIVSPKCRQGPTSGDFVAGEQEDHGGGLASTGADAFDWPGAVCRNGRRFRRQRAICVSETGAEHNVGAFRAEVLGGRPQDRAHLVGRQVGFALEHQRHDAAHFGCRIRCAGRHLIAVLGIATMICAGGYRDVAPRLECSNNLSLASVAVTAITFGSAAG